MLNNSSISFPNYSSLQSFLSNPIIYPSIITWKQIKRQHEEYGNKEIEYLEII
jgi:hypothetical protein